MRGRLRPVETESDDDGVPELIGKALAPQEAAPPKADERVSKAAMGFLMLSIKQLSQKTLVALSASFTLLLAASAWWLWLSVIAAPTPPQLTGLGLYCLFILALEFVRRRPG